MATRKTNLPASAEFAPVSQGYTVLARRYRPQQFRDLVGQEAAPAERHKPQVEPRAIDMPGELDEQLLQAAQLQRLGDVSDPNNFVL